MASGRLNDHSPGSRGELHCQPRAGSGTSTRSARSARSGPFHGGGWCLQLLRPRSRRGRKADPGGLHSDTRIGATGLCRASPARRVRSATPSPEVEPTWFRVRGCRFERVRASTSRGSVRGWALVGPLGPRRRGLCNRGARRPPPAATRVRRSPLRLPSRHHRAREGSDHRLAPGPGTGAAAGRLSTGPSCPHPEEDGSAHGRRHQPSGCPRKPARPGNFTFAGEGPRRVQQGTRCAFDQECWPDEPGDGRLRRRASLGARAPAHHRLPRRGGGCRSQASSRERASASSRSDPEVISLPAGSS